MSTLLVCATPQECRFLPLEGAREAIIGRRQAYVLNDAATLVISGVGKVNTAQAVTAAVEAGQRISAVVSFGAAGAFPAAGLATGELLVATEEVSDELVVLPGRLASLEEIGLPLGGGSEPNYGRFPADPTLSEALLAACERATGTKAVSGTFLTVSRITSSLAESERLTRCLGRVLCESMEGAAAAQVAHHYGLPFGELRAVSNQIEDRERQRWDFEAAAISCARALGAFLGGPR